MALERLPTLQQAAAAIHADLFAWLGIWRHNRVFWTGCETVPELAVLVAPLRVALRGAGFAAAGCSRG